MQEWYGAPARSIPPELLRAGRPPRVSERAWSLLIAHAVERKPYAELAAREGCSPSRIGELVLDAAVAAWARQACGPDPFEGLPQREKNTLNRNGVRTPEQAAALGDRELLALTNMGKHGVRTVRAWLAGRAAAAVDGNGQH